MHLRNKYSTIYNLTIAVLVIALLTPSFAKLAHVFANHTHEICVDYQKTHIHEFDVDCEFYKFKLNKQFSHTLDNFDITEVEVNYKLSASQYQFISEYQRLQISLRGPPVLV